MFFGESHGRAKKCNLVTLQLLLRGCLYTVGDTVARERERERERLQEQSTKVWSSVPGTDERHPRRAQKSQPSLHTEQEALAANVDGPVHIQT